MSRTHASVQASTTPVATHVTPAVQRTAAPALASSDVRVAERRPRAGHHFGDVSFVEPAVTSVQRDPTDPPSTPLDNVRRMLAGTYAAFLLRNQAQQLRGGAVDPSSRLGALQHTARFQPGTVGHGAHWGISQVHAFMGNIGQSTIGNLFGGARAQQMMAQPIYSPGNMGLARMEHGFWRNALANPASLGEWFGGLVGSTFPPFSRGGLQMFGNLARTAAPRAAMRAGPVGAAGYLSWDALQSLFPRRQ
jgi:hypothetical protein